MSVTSGNLVWYGSAAMQESDSGTQGGAISTSTKVTFTDISANGTVEALSSSNSDSGNLVVYGRNTAGSIINETLTLLGTGIITSTNSYERILKATLSALPTGVVTLRKSSDDVTILTLESGVTGVRRPFYNVSANPSTGPTKTYYEKVFLKNNNSTFALLSATISENSDGTEANGADITFDLDIAQNGTTTCSDRQTAPTGLLSSFNDTYKSVPSTDLGPGSGIGVWMKLGLPSGVSPQNTTFSFASSGNTT